MIPQLILVGGVFFWLLSDGERTKDPEPEPTPEPEPEPTPPVPVTPTNPLYQWNLITSDVEEGLRPSEPNNVVWQYSVLMGLEYDSDGDGESDIDNTSYRDYFVIGNPSHTRFLRTNSDNGTIDIPAAATGDSDAENVRVFATEADAIQKLRDLEPEEPEDEDDGNGGGFTLPTRPTFPLGQNGGYSVM